MDFSKNSVRLFVKLFVLVSVLFIGGAIILRLYKEDKHPERFEASNQESQVLEYSLPQIVNSPVESISLGEEFVFLPSLVPLEEGVDIILISSPVWMSFDQGILSGNPSEAGPFHFVLRVKKDDFFYDQDYYLIVYDINNE